MNKSGVTDKVLRLANKHGVTVGDLVGNMIQETGSVTSVSVKLGVSPNVARYHLLRSGWKFDKASAQWVKPQPEAAR